MLSSDISLWILFPEAETDVVDAHDGPDVDEFVVVNADADEDDDLPPIPPDIIILLFKKDAPFGGLFLLWLQKQEDRRRSNWCETHGRFGEQKRLKKWWN